MANPIKRIRDGKRYFKPQQKITFEEWEEITDRAAQAEVFFKLNRVTNTLKDSLSDAESMILENRVREVHEEHTIAEGLKKIFITPKKIQDDELVGQIKFIRSYFAELKTWIDFKADLEKKEADGVISIERSKDERTD